MSTSKCKVIDKIKSTHDETDLDVPKPPASADITGRSRLDYLGESLKDLAFVVVIVTLAVMVFADIN